VLVQRVNARYDARAGLDLLCVALVIQFEIFHGCVVDE
jgi:hypothetical protein